MTIKNFTFNTVVVYMLYFVLFYSLFLICFKEAKEAAIMKSTVM